MKYVKSTDGTKVAVYDQIPKSHDKTIVLIHGWPLNHKQFEYQIPDLLHAGYRVVTMDLRGFGNSEAPADGYDYKQMATDVHAVIKSLELDSFDLLGFSMGGAIAVKYMSLFDGDGVNKLCLLDAAVPSYSESDRNEYGQSVEDTESLIDLGYYDRPALNEYFGSIFFEKKHTPAFYEWFQRIADSASGIGEMKALESLLNEDVFDDLSTIKVKIAIFHGLQDKICQFEMAEIMHSEIQGSVLFDYDKAGHGMFYDSLDEFNDDLISFLNET